MKQTALKLINYLYTNNIQIIKNDDEFIINLLISTQIQLLEYAFNVKPGEETKAIQLIKHNMSVRQSYIAQLLNTAMFAVSVKDKDFNFLSKEYLDSLIIS